ncbi:glycoside hydrolase family 127 protein [Agarilytica rhodophyticola]|uniref:glycoside hydrolase family 127 protein n=1 Tax=Agarilytica rhodophyticola TaxID=1737490 RepID=UPI000B3468D8|nr:beta-L-arabinofuranosidase domain-containing protein [Agarilytica rhodophyticola]
MKIRHAHQNAVNANSQSPHVTFRSINIGDCQWTEGFWAEKFELAEKIMVPHMGELLKGDIGHAYNNFKIAAGLIEGEAKGMLWHDGDFYKWMEAATYIYAINHDASILNELDEIIEVINKAQQDDGYLHTHIQILGLDRWSSVTHHELYNSGHLITGACIYHRITGRTNWLDIAKKHADYLYGVFASKPESLARFGFNPSQIMALVELYRTTRNDKYLELADIFVTMRGSVPMELHSSVPYWFTGDQCQMKTPLREETEAVGHAVTAMYLYAGAADVYSETGDKTLLDALNRLWQSATQKKMYLTGALGQVHHGAYDDQNMIHEGFIDDYLMPNSTAYNETCASIANAMFNWRMLGITGEAKYADIIELVLYNGAMVGISSDGKKYFYANPLRMNHGQREYSDHCDCTESADRESYIECFCCPPNLVRTIAQVSSWAYNLCDNGVVVNIFGSNKLNTKMLDGSSLSLTQKTQYPWNGKVDVFIDECKDEAFEILLRIPEWADGAKIFVNGSEVAVETKPGSYARIERRWQKGDCISLDMPMEINLVEGHPRIEEVRNQVAIKRGPLVYCIESPDLPENTKILDVYLSVKSQLSAEYRPEFLGGVSVITGRVLLRSDDRVGMYRKFDGFELNTHETIFVPYYAWSNRGTSEMTVFMPAVL